MTLLWVVVVALVATGTWIVGGHSLRRVLEDRRDRRLRRQFRDTDPDVRNAALRETVSWARKVLTPRPARHPVRRVLVWLVALRHAIREARS